MNKYFCGAVFEWKSGVDRKTVRERKMIRHSTAINASRLAVASVADSITTGEARGQVWIVICLSATYLT